MEGPKQKALGKPSLHIHILDVSVEEDFRWASQAAVAAEKELAFGIEWGGQNSDLLV